MMDLPPLFIWAVTVFYGLALGSFTTCIAYRVPRGLSVWRNPQGSDAYRSFCPQCRKPLKPRDLVPVFSWLIQRGKCRYCGKSIGISYLLIELMTVILVTALVAGVGFNIPAFLLSWLIPGFTALYGFFQIKHIP